MEDDEDWVGTPPEGRYSRDRAKPEFWLQGPARRLAGAGLAIVVLILVVVLLLR